MKIKWDHVFNEAIGVTAGVALIGALFLLANKFFGAFSYNGLSSDQIGTVMKNLTSNYQIISTVKGKSIWGEDYARGILSGNGGILYYYKFHYRNGAPTGIEIYPTIFEKWDVSPAIFDSARLL